MWRRPLNSITLAIATHKELDKVSDGTNTQVEIRMINKWRVKIIQRRIYKVNDPFMEWGIEKEKEKIVKQSKPLWYSRVIIISIFNLLGLKFY